eukprot:EG_transcript_32440
MENLADVSHKSPPTSTTPTWDDCVEKLSNCAAQGGPLLLILTTIILFDLQNPSTLAAHLALKHFLVDLQVLQNRPKSILSSENTKPLQNPPKSILSSENTKPPQSEKSPAKPPKFRYRLPPFCAMWLSSPVVGGTRTVLKGQESPLSKNFFPLRPKVKKKVSFA